jgi:hypothetical protein
VSSFTPRPFYRQGKSPFYPLDRRLGGLQSRSEHGGKGKGKGKGKVKVKVKVKVK